MVPSDKIFNCPVSPKLKREIFCYSITFSTHAYTSTCSRDSETYIFSRTSGRNECKYPWPAAYFYFPSFAFTVILMLNYDIMVTPFGRQLSIVALPACSNINQCITITHFRIAFSKLIKLNNNAYNHINS